MVYFLILHYMVDKVTEKCVDSILKLNGEKKIVIVDNLSPNDSFEKLKKYYSNDEDVYVIQNSENNGFAKGNNYGYEFIKNNFKDAKFIIAMNNDMEILQKDFIEKIKEEYKKEKFYIMGPDIFSIEKGIHQNPEIEEHTIRNIEAINREINRVTKRNKTKLFIKGIIFKIPGSIKLLATIKKHKRSSDTRYMNKHYNCTLHGSCLIFSKDFISKRDYAFYPNTTFYCEAQILDYQCEKNNWLRVYCPELHVIHYEDLATNATYKSYVKKLEFQNKCLLESYDEFKKLIKEDNKKRKKNVKEK